jgi:hypothetical protein
MESSGSGVIDFGRFLTGFFVVMGIGECSFVADGGRLTEELEVLYPILMGTGSRGTENLY